MTTIRRRILVAEDNPAMATVLKFNLEQAGFLVTACPNGRAALGVARENRFDLIITDQQMPEMCGQDFCRAMRQLDGYDTVPVMMLTAKSLELDGRQLQEELGVLRLVPKPFSPQDVVEWVQQTLAEAAANTE